MLARSLTLALASSLVILTACGSDSTGSTSSSGSSGSSGTEPNGPNGSSGSTGSTPPVTTAKQRAIVKITLAKCTTATQDGDAYLVGSFSPVNPIDDGASDNGHPVAVDCNVGASGSSFSIDTTVNTDGVGALELQGTVDSTGSTQAGIVTFTKTGTGTWDSASCVFGPPASANQGVAAGRFWAPFHCEGATETSTNANCDVDGEIRIENCTAK